MAHCRSPMAYVWSLHSPPGLRSSAPPGAPNAMDRDQVAQRWLVADEHDSFAALMGPDRREDAHEIAGAKGVGIFDIGGDAESPVNDLGGLAGAAATGWR